jgi:hypothetical protein
MVAARSRFSHANHIRRRKYLHISLRALKTRQRAIPNIFMVSINLRAHIFIFIGGARSRLIASSWCVPRYAFVISTLKEQFLPPATKNIQFRDRTSLSGLLYARTWAHLTF